jgi:membrane dipeptidase
MLLSPTRPWVPRSAAIAVAVGLLCGLPDPARPAPRELGPFPVVDLHVDLSYQAMWKQKTLSHGSGQYEAAWLRESGVSGVVLPLFVPNGASPGGPQMKHLDKAHATLERELPGIAPYTTRTCQGGDGVEAFYAFEGSAPLGRELDSVFRWARRGVRFYGLVHSQDNLLATSAGYGPKLRSKQSGLSATGKELVRRVHATFGIVDVSHASDAAVADVLRHAAADDCPVVATHSNARALANHARNLTDAQLRAIAERGGIIGVNFHSPFLLGGSGRAELSDVVRHIRHIARVAGIDAVAIGSDFEGGIRPPRELQDARGFPRLARALLDDGFTQREVERILEKNARRLLCRTRD